MKALEILNQQLRDETLWLYSHEEAIKELEEAMKPKRCDGCIREAEDMQDPHCAFCSRACNDNFAAKDNA